MRASRRITVVAWALMILALTGTAVAVWPKAAPAGESFVGAVGR
jgi:hypothetical protein